MTAQSSSDGESGANAPPNTGLGRGLSGILGDVAGHAPAREVSALLGSSGVRNSPEVRRIVGELAVDTISASFSADGVLMARLGAKGEVDPLQTRLGGTWAPNDPLGFEVNGRLWNCLTERTSVQGQVPVGRLNVLFARHKIGPVVIATAVVRSRAFDKSERDQLAGLIKSAARATEVDASLPEEASLQVGVTPLDGGNFASAVELEIAGSARTGNGTGSSADAATATAAIEALGLDVEVRFAGSTDMGDDRVTIVVLSTEFGTVFGLAVSDAASGSGGVEATFSAAVSAGLDPFTTAAVA